MSNNATDAEQSAAVTNPILVTGAAGQVESVGFNIVVLLRARGLPVRAMVRRDDDRSNRLVRSHHSAEKLRSAFPGPPVYATSDSNWQEQVREALGGYKLEVAFDAIGGKAIDNLASVVDDGGTIMNFGSLGGNMGTNMYSLVPNNVALKSVSMMSWFRVTPDEKQKDFGLALSLATNHPELFEVAHAYEFDDFQKSNAEQCSTSLAREKPGLSY